MDVRGGAPGTRETDLLDPVNTVQKVQAIVLSGGSAFGLAAATGTVRWLEEKGLGEETRVARVPIVPAAILFDLGIGDPKVRPTADCGYEAAAAATDGAVAEGNVGAGAGATVGKLLRSRPLHEGGPRQRGHRPARRAGGGGPRGGECPRRCRSIRPRVAWSRACARPTAGAWPTRAPWCVAVASSPRPRRANTTIGVVATNAILTKTQATKVAQMAHDGYARALSPVHTPGDGDVIFALATGTWAARGRRGHRSAPSPRRSWPMRSSARRGRPRAFPATPRRGISRKGATKP